MPKTKPAGRPLHPLQLFVPSGALEFVTMDIVGELPKTFNYNYFVLVMTYRYSKIMRTVTTSKYFVAYGAIVHGELDNYIQNVYISIDGQRDTADTWDFGSAVPFFNTKYLITFTYHL